LRPSLTSNGPAFADTDRSKLSSTDVGGKRGVPIWGFNKLCRSSFPQAKSVNKNDLQGGLIRVGCCLKVGSWGKFHLDLEVIWEVSPLFGVRGGGGKKNAFIISGRCIHFLLSQVV